MADKFSTIRYVVSRCRVCDKPPNFDDPFFPNLLSHIANGSVVEGGEFDDTCRNHVDKDNNVIPNQHLKRVTMTQMVPLEDEDTPKETDGPLEPA